MYSILLGLVIIAAALLVWRDCLRAKELAASVGRQICASYGVQFLDDTVALDRIGPIIERGRPAFRRVYLFEYSRAGDDRRRGSLTLAGTRLEAVFLSEPPI